MVRRLTARVGVGVGVGVGIGVLGRPELGALVTEAESSLDMSRS